MSGVRTPRPARVPVPHPHPLEVPQAWSLQPNRQRLRVRRQPIKRWTLQPSPGMIASSIPTLSICCCAYSNLKIHMGLRFLKTFGRPRAQKQMLLTRLLLYGSDLYSNHGILTLSLPSTFIPRLPGPFLLRRQGEDHLRSDLGLPDRGQPHMGEPTPELHSGFSLRHCRNSILQGKCTNSKTSI